MSELDAPAVTPVSNATSTSTSPSTSPKTNLKLQPNDMDYGELFDNSVVFHRLPDDITVSDDSSDGAAVAAPVGDHDDVQFNFGKLQELPQLRQKVSSLLATNVVYWMQQNSKSAVCSGSLDAVSFGSVVADLTYNVHVVINSTNIASYSISLERQKDPTDCVLIETVIYDEELIYKKLNLLKENNFMVKAVFCLTNVLFPKLGTFNEMCDGVFCQIPLITIYNIEKLRKYKLHGYHPIARKLISISKKKRTRVIFAADFRDYNETKKIITNIHEYICAVKINPGVISAIASGSSKSPASAIFADLMELAQRLDILIISDMNISNTGDIAAQQIIGPDAYFPCQHASMVTLQCTAGAHSLKTLCSHMTRLNANKNCGFLLVADMVTEGCLIDIEYSSKVYKMAEENRSCVIGFMNHCAMKSPSGFINITSEVITNETSSRKKSDLLSKTIDQAFYMANDFIIIGDGISQWTNYESVAKQCAAESWRCKKYSSKLRDKIIQKNSTKSQQ